MEIRLQYEATEPRRLNAILGSAHRLIEMALDSNAEGCVWSLMESLWPALSMSDFSGKHPQNVSLELIPLSRIGQMEGKSGSLVLIGTFRDIDNQELPSSHPVVIKTRPVNDGERLREEYDNSRRIKQFAYDSKDGFAIPILFDDTQEVYHVLWSLLSCEHDAWKIATGDDGNVEPRVRDLRQSLFEGSSEKSLAIINDAFELLEPLHQRLGQACVEKRKYGDEYQWYLRGLEDGTWGSEWQEEWGGNATEVKDAGGQFSNPFVVYNKIRDTEKPLRIGAIHGDLHPGNIVLTKQRPRIIDFGWSQDRVHIAKDFVLLECNLRFHTVRPQLKQADVYTMSDWIAWGAPIPDELCTYGLERIKLIAQLRKIAEKSIASDGYAPEWDWEYLVPLFLVSLGMLRFSPLLGNQQAAVRFVLSLATHIDRSCFPEAES